MLILKSHPYTYDKQTIQPKFPAPPISGGCRNVTIVGRGRASLLACSLLRPLRTGNRIRRSRRFGFRWSNRCRHCRPIRKGRVLLRFRHRSCGERCGRCSYQRLFRSTGGIAELRSFNDRPECRWRWYSGSRGGSSGPSRTDGAVGGCGLYLFRCQWRSHRDHNGPRHIATRSLTCECG